MYDDSSTAKVAGGYLNHKDILVIEDWGCGFGGFEEFIGQHQQYRGIDGSHSPAASLVTDLEFYTTSVDAIHMRGVIEHNMNWEKVLDNALASFTRRMVLTLFTPYQDATRVIDVMPNFQDTGVDMIDVGFVREDIVERFGDIGFLAIENIKTDTKYNVEHMFLLEKT